MSLLVLGSVPSTMDVARDMLRMGQVVVTGINKTQTIEPNGIIALDQTEGRGQRGRNWYSRPGESMCATFVLPINSQDIRQPARISLAAGAAAIKLLVTLYGNLPEIKPDHGTSQSAKDRVDSRFGLKWPNDIMVGLRKLGGILIEIVTPDAMHASIRRNFEAVALIGAGININNRRFPVDLVQKSTSLAMEGLKSVPPQLLAEQYWQMLQDCLQEQNASGFESTLSYWRQYDSTSGRKYQIDPMDESSIGIANGIDDSGAVIIKMSDGKCLSVMSASSLRDV